MTKRLVFINNTEFNHVRFFELRQGLDPLLAMESGWVGSFSASNFVSVAPDGQFLVMAMGSGATSNSLSRYEDVANLTDRTSIGLTLPGQAYCCAAGPTHYAYGGASSGLFVFDRATHSLQSVASSGLGSVQSIDFSQDGQKMVVGSLTAPYLRIYNTSDWSYIVPTPAPSSGCYGVAFSPDSSKVISRHISGAFTCVFDAETGVRLHANTTAGSAVSPGASSSISFSPLDPNVAIFSLASSPFIAQMDVVSGVYTAWTAPVPAVATGVGSVIVDPDPAEDAVYLFHNSGSSARLFTKFRISAKAMYPEQPASLVNMLSGRVSSSSTTFAAYIQVSDRHRIIGVVRDIDNLPAERVVRALRRSDGALMGQTKSDAVTGEYSIIVYEPGPFDMQFMTEDGELLNDLFFAKVQPEPL